MVQGVMNAVRMLCECCMQEMMDAVMIGRRGRLRYDKSQDTLVKGMSMD